MFQFAKPEDEFIDISNESTPGLSNFSALVCDLYHSTDIVRSINQVLYAISTQLQRQESSAGYTFSHFEQLMQDVNQGRVGVQQGDLSILPGCGNAYFISDCEGAYHRLVTFLSRHKILEQLELSPSHDPVHLVVLGDSVDRSTTSLPFLELLLKLQKEFPGQVHILAGNHELYAEHQKTGDGFYMEIMNRSFTVSDLEWHNLRLVPFFLEHFRGDRETAGLEWETDSAKRAKLCQEYLDAVHGSRAELDRETADLSKALEGGEQQLETDFQIGVSDYQVMIRNIRAQAAKSFLWDLYQVWFAGLPKALVSPEVFASHSLIPASGVFSTEALSVEANSPHRLLYELSRTSQLPESERSERLEDMLWSDLECQQGLAGDSSTPHIEFNSYRGMGKIMNQATIELFLKAIGRKIHIRGHQSIDASGYHVDGPVHTIHSSSRSGGACVKVALALSEGCPAVERMEFR